MSILKYACLLVSFLTSSIVTDDNFTITPITTSSGLYYEKIGEVLLSNDNWQFVTSVDYEGYLLFYEYLFIQASKIQLFCEKVAIKECASVYQGISGSIKRIADTDEIMAHFLGIESHRRRVKRFWQELALQAAPYFLEPLGKAFTSKIFGDGEEVDLQVYDQQITELQKSQQDLNDKIDQQATVFKIDSERKDFQIQWLDRTQTDIKDKIKILEGTFSKDSEEKAKEIQELQNMLAETRDKIKMQQEAQNKLANELDHIKIELKNVNEDIDQINKEINEIDGKLNMTTILAKLNGLSISLNFLFIEFETRQKELLGVIKNANRGELDPYIITPLNLIKMLVNVQPVLPEGTKLPFYPNIENAHKLYTLIKPTVYLYNNKILFVLRIPLVNFKNFNLHKMTSVPVPVASRKFLFIYPKQPYLLLDKKEQDFTLLSSEDFQVYCGEIATATYLCDQIRQISSVIASSSECEIQLFLHSKKIPGSCQKRVLYLEKPIFLQLQKPKSWIYVVPDSEHLTFTCDKKRKSILVNGTGFIHAGTECSVRTSDFQLVPIAKFSKPVFSTFFPTVNVSDSIDMERVESLTIEHFEEHQQIFSSIDFEELKDVSWDVKTIFATSKASLYIGIVCGVVFILLILVLSVLYRRAKARSFI